MSEQVADVFIGRTIVDWMFEYPYLTAIMWIMFCCAIASIRFGGKR